jgi:isocitrate/isopropylmalate dehydrogenase
MSAARKVTVVLPEELLDSAMEATGEGLTSTIRRGLELVAAGRAARQLRRLRGKVKLSIDLAALREDRR